jgi:histidine triad (HIT) family protein|tara:strand:- start:8554 stop:8943 length:390 start_codon:yes stop_codon:yes gene_type:complete
LTSIFTKIINKEIPCFKIHEDDNCIAFLDINPNSIGHTLCVLKKEIDYLFNLSSNEYTMLMNFSKKVASGIEKSVDCKRIGLAVVGLEVPHVHIHLIPINSVNDMNFSNSINLKKEDFEKLSIKIKNNI